MNDNFYYFRKNTPSQMFDRVLVCTPLPPLSAGGGGGGGGGGNHQKNFQKGGLTGPQILEGSC